MPARVHMRPEVRAIAFVIFILLLATHASAQTFTITGTSNVDNFHRLFSGPLEPASSADLTEQTNGVQSYNVNLPQYNFSVGATDEYLYLVAWSDGGVQQGAAAELTMNPGNINLSSGTGWEVYPTGIGGTPSDADIAASIQNANLNMEAGWEAVATNPLDGLAGFSSVLFPNNVGMWHDSGLDSRPCTNPGIPNAAPPFCPGFDHAEFLVFRTPIQYRITGTSNVDNFHQVYSGPHAPASDSELIERTLGVKSFNVNLPQYDFQIGPNEEYLYLVAWSDGGVQQAAAAELLLEPLGFNLSSGPYWRVFPSGLGASPTAAEVVTSIDVANMNNDEGWLRVSTIPLNGLANFSPTLFPSDQGMWYDSELDSRSCTNPGVPGGETPFCPGFDHDEYLIFRIPTPVPEPALGAGLVAGLVGGILLFAWKGLRRSRATP